MSSRAMSQMCIFDNLKIEPNLKYLLRHNVCNLLRLIIITPNLFVVPQVYVILNARFSMCSQTFLLYMDDSSSCCVLNYYVRCHESGYHSLKLHITHGLHLPSCTALTHSRPPLHQSHSCHHSLINPDCLTTPAPHSLTHIKAAHKHSLTAKSCFAPADILSVILPAISVFDPGLPDLGTLNLCLCLWPRPLPGIVYVSALPLIFLLCPLTIACVILPLSNKHILLHLDPLPLTSLYIRNPS